MQKQLKRAFEKHFGDETRFFRVWLENTRQVGTPLPTSSWTGKAMSAPINLNSGLPVLELGPGTGSITREILRRGLPPQRLVAIEYSPEFVARLRQRFPQAQVHQGDAFALDKSVESLPGVMFDCVISALPLLNFPPHTRMAFINDMLDRVPSGRPLVQVTYGTSCPSPVPEGVEARRADIVFRNLPPAHVWTFTRQGA